MSQNKQNKTKKSLLQTFGNQRAFIPGIWLSFLLIQQVFTEPLRRMLGNFSYLQNPKCDWCTSIRGNQERSLRMWVVSETWGNEEIHSAPAGQEHVERLGFWILVLALTSCMIFSHRYLELSVLQFFYLYNGDINICTAEAIWLLPKQTNKRCFEC